MDGRACLRTTGVTVSYAVIMASALIGINYIIGAYQSASFSVAADPVMAEIYKTRAILSLPIGAIFIVLAIAGFVFIKRFGRGS